MVIIGWKINDIISINKNDIQIPIRDNRDNITDYKSEIEYDIILKNKEKHNFKCLESEFKYDDMDLYKYLYSKRINITDKIYCELIRTNSDYFYGIYMNYKITEFDVDYLLQLKNDLKSKLSYLFEIDIDPKLYIIE